MDDKTRSNNNDKSILFETLGNEAIKSLSAIEEVHASRSPLAATATASGSSSSSSNEEQQQLHRWIRIIELGYDGTDELVGNVTGIEKYEPICFHCGRTTQHQQQENDKKEEEGGGGESSVMTAKSTTKLKQLMKCGKCQVVMYCSKTCQTLNWKNGGNNNDSGVEGRNNNGATVATIGHKFTCNAFKRVGDDMIILCTTDKEEIRHEILSKIRFYAYPYAVFTAQNSQNNNSTVAMTTMTTTTTNLEGGDDNYNTINSSTRGFLFIQSDSSLAVMSLPIPILSSGHAYPHCRSVILHYLTVNEFITEVCNKHDFELTCMTNELRNAVETYNEMNELVILMRFRCGHVALGIETLVPDYNLCLVLGKEYYGADEIGQPVQLNIDDM